MRPSIVKEQRWKNKIKLANPRETYHGRISLGNLSEYPVLICRLDEDQYFVGITSMGCYTFRPTYKHWTYVADKLHLGEKDARNLADLLNVFFGVPGYVEQGVYDDRYCD